MLNQRVSWGKDECGVNHLTGRSSKAMLLTGEAWQGSTNGFRREHFGWVSEIRRR